MHAAAAILLDLFVIFVAAQIGAEIAQRIRLPGVVGEIVAGCIIGPSALGWLDATEILGGTPLDVLAELGVVLLLFSVGLETRLDDLRKVGRSAFLVGVLGVVIPFALGTLWAHGVGYEWRRA
jgi:Kef-type K+ transport system membrane component KefB